MKSLKIQNVNKMFGSFQALENIDLDIEPGQFLILVGPSGCGKSTLLNMIAGLESVTSGDILIDDKNVTQLSPKDRDIAMVFQSYALYPNMTIRKNISFSMEMRNVSKKDQEDTVNRVAKMLQIERLLDKKPFQLSGGQRQRVAMGRALARDPSLFLFDEPLSNLDAKLRVEMRAEIKQLHQRTKTSIVYVTHDQIEAMTLGDVIAVMKEGVIQQFGTPKEIYDNPKNRFVAGFMGSPSMNFIVVKVVDNNGNADVELENNGQTIVLPCSQYFNGLENKIGEEVTMGLRPEQIKDVGSGVGDITIDCEVEMVEPTGPDTLLSVTLNNTKTICRIHPDTKCQLGSIIPLTFDLSKVVFFDHQTGDRIL